VILEIRTYLLRRGERDEFARVMQSEALPLLARDGIRVVDCGGSLVDEEGETAYLIRAFASLAEREAQESAFYSSRDWREGPREAIVSRIESMHTVVVDTSPQAVEALASATHVDRDPGDGSRRPPQAPGSRASPM
jgi:hypothetical protein